MIIQGTDKMKKAICLLFICLFTSAIYCNEQACYEFENQEYYFCAYYDDLRSPPFKFSFDNGVFYMDIPELDDINIANEKPIKDSIQGRYTIRNENGFIYLLAADKKFLVLHSETVICVLIDCLNNDAFFGLNKNSKYISEAEGRRTFVGITGRNPFHHNVSSFLTETIRGKTIKYDGTNENYYYELTKPWVEGAEGYGIGEWIEKQPAGNAHGIVFFNGYIDPNRPDLYYANSRIKEVAVTSKQGEFIFPIRDIPNPQILLLPEGFNEILRFTIKDVYRGSKYSDTCLAGIYFLRIRGQ